MFRGEKHLSRNLQAPHNNFLGISEVRPTFGSITAVDLTAYTASVMSNNGELHNVMIPIQGYSRGTGIFITPAKGDFCLVEMSITGVYFMTAIYSVTPENDVKTKRLKVPKHHTIDIHTKAGDDIKLSENADTAGITVTSPKMVSFSVPGGDGSALVSKAELETIINQLVGAINTLTFTVIGSTTGPPTNPIQAPTVIGIAGLQTVKAEDDQLLPAETAEKTEDVTSAQDDLGTAQQNLQQLYKEPVVTTVLTAEAKAQQIYDTLPTPENAAILAAAKTAAAAAHTAIDTASTTIATATNTVNTLSTELEALVDDAIQAAKDQKDVIAAEVESTAKI